MFHRLSVFLTKHSIIIKPSQFGFRVGHNTTDAVLEFIHNVYTSFNKNVSTMTIFLDFSKAFHTVNHDILVSMLLVMDSAAWRGLVWIVFARSKAICCG